MEYDSQVYLLSERFVNDYPLTDFPELMYKKGRPYTCLLIETHSEFLICVPFRTSINHPNAFHFKGTKRSLKSHSGLDYSKSVIIKNNDYIDSKAHAVVDQDEYRELMRNLPTIVNEVLDYVDTYINHLNGFSVIHQKAFERMYSFTTLKYFHKELGIKTYIISSKASHNNANN